MRDFQLVERPSIFPAACVLCASQKGPQVDTFVEIHAGRGYICKMCAGLIAKAFGFALKPDYETAQQQATEYRARAEQLAAELEDAQKQTHDLSGRLARQGDELAQWQSERVAMNRALQAQGRELTQARAAGFESADDVRARTLSEIADTASEKPKDRRSRAATT